jgi:hypothetical protein
VPVWKGLLSPITLHDIADEKKLDEYLVETNERKLTALWKATAPAVWATLKGIGLKKGANVPVTYLNILTKEDLEAIEKASDIFDQKPQFFAAYGTVTWSNLLAAYITEITDILTDRIGSKTPEYADFPAVKASLERKLEWIFTEHDEEVTRRIPLPLATPKLLESLCVSLGQISNALQEVSNLLVPHRDMNGLTYATTSSRHGSTHSFYDLLEVLRHLNCQRML